jgi:hypothetical protein
MCVCFCVLTSLIWKPFTYFYVTLNWSCGSYGRRTRAVNWNTLELHLSGRWLSGPARRFGLICREFYKTNTPWSYRLSDQVHYSAMLWLLELQIRYDWKVLMQVLTVNSNNRTSNCRCSLFWKKNPTIRIFCISGWLAVQLFRISGVLLYCIRGNFCSQTYMGAKWGWRCISVHIFVNWKLNLSTNVTHCEEGNGPLFSWRYEVREGPRTRLKLW